MGELHRTKVLFVCSRNRCRSLTAERLFADVPGWEVRSVGTQSNARITINRGHLGWADLIFVMERSHLGRMRERFGEDLDGKTIVALHIPDDYEYMQPELVDELGARVEPYLPRPSAG